MTFCLLTSPFHGVRSGLSDIFVGLSPQAHAWRRQWICAVYNTVFAQRFLSEIKGVSRDPESPKTCYFTALMQCKANPILFLRLSVRHKRWYVWCKIAQSHNITKRVKKNTWIRMQGTPKSNKLSCLKTVPHKKFHEIHPQLCE